MQGSREQSSPAVSPQAEADYMRIERAIAYLREHRLDRPQLRDLAQHIGLSESHTQRLFSRWAGISPKRFQQFLTVQEAKRRMRHTGDLLGLALDTGLSGPGRLHDVFVSMEAMTPGEFRHAAAGVVIRYASGDTPFGQALVAFTPRGICHLSFVVPQTVDGAVAALRTAWPGARLEKDQ
ncbi:MAG: AraC family transcriptional regulator, partial [Sedimenticolaceae bacterium]